MQAFPPILSIGLMSGTSLDGIDVALLRTDGDGIVEAGPSRTFAYDPELRRRLLASLNAEAATRAIQSAERALTRAHAAAVREFSKKPSISIETIRIIGFHGHTISHRPERRFTWQLGDGELLGGMLGVDVVNDFRSADMRAGGQGAPLAPLYHLALAGSLPKPLAVLNIGGVANVTWIGERNVLAFDTGPGNALLDDWMASHIGRPIDRDGEAARSGRVDTRRVAQFLSHPYLEKYPPKSLDRNSLTVDLEGLSMVDGAATLVAITAAAVGAARVHFPIQPKRWLVTGGGRHNRTMMDRLRQGLGAPVDPVETVGWRGDALEAQAFAYLAVRSLRGLPLSLPGTTGCAVPTTGGRLWSAGLVKRSP